MKKPILIVMVGPSASGKSSIAQELSIKDGYIVVSSDAIRVELGDIQDQTKNKEVFQIFYNRLRKALIENGKAIADATYLTLKSRAKLMEAVSNIDCYKIAHVVIKSKAQCKRDDAQRDRIVGAKVIDRQFKQFVMPTTDEGFDVINTYYVFNSRATR